jgi:hypothetical protein
MEELTLAALICRVFRSSSRICIGQHKTLGFNRLGAHNGGSLASWVSFVCHRARRLTVHPLSGADLLAIPAELIPARRTAAATIACWFIDSDYNGESFFVRQAYFLGQNDPYKSLKTSLKAEIDQEAWESLNSDTSVPFAKPSTGRIAVKVINHLGDEVMKVYRV